MRKLLLQRFAFSFIPFFAITLPFANLVSAPTLGPDEVRKVTEAMIIERERAAALDSYFAKYQMPLEGYGLKLVREAEKNHIDWRLMAAIAVRESSGGKHQCGNNPFGWGSCKINFDSIDEAVEIVALNLGGGNPRTKAYYKGDTREKLLHYNGKVIPPYPEEVLWIMERISPARSETRR